MSQVTSTVLLFSAPLLTTAIDDAHRSFVLGVGPIANIDGVIVLVTLSVVVERIASRGTIFETTGNTLI